MFENIILLNPTDRSRSQQFRDDNLSAEILFYVSRIGAATHERLATDHRGTESKVYGAIDAAIGPSDPLLARKVKVIGGKAQSWESDRLEWKYGSDRIHQRCDSK